MSNFTGGTYYPEKSIIHRLSSFTKIVCLIPFLVMVIASDTIWEYAALTVLVGAAVLLSRLSVTAVLGSVKKTSLFFLLVLIMNTLFFSSDNAWVQWWIFTPSVDGLRQGGIVVLRVIYILIFSNIITMTTPPIEITKAIEQLIYPLKFAGVPISQVAMILSVAIGFVSTLMQEAEAIKLSQTARGGRLDSSRLSEKAGAVMPLVVPIFLTAFKRADELSLAMESRGYRVNKKKKIKAPRLRAVDVLLIVAFVIFATSFVLIK